MFIAHPKGRLEQTQSLEPESSPIFTTINTFKELMDYLNQAPEAQRTEILLADFSARVAVFEGENVCLGLLKDHYKLIEATLLLRQYGISFSTRRSSDNVLLIYARARETKPPMKKMMTLYLISHASVCDTPQPWGWPHDTKSRLSFMSR